MQSRSVAISTAFHVAVFIIATVSLPWLKRDFEIPQPVSVELVDIATLTQTNKVVKQPAPPKEDKKELPPTPPKPTVAQNTATEAATPVKEKPPEKEEPKKDDKVLVDPAAPPEKKKTPKEEKKKETTKAEPKKDFASILKNLADTKDAPPVKAELPDLKLDEPSTPEAGAIAPLGTKLTMSEEDALRHQLEGCWNMPMGAKDAADLKVDIYMVVNPDRTLRESRVVDQSRYNSDSFFRAAADSALRAVRNPLCSPFQVPEDKYDVWKTITVTFDPSQMF